MAAPVSTTSAMLIMAERVHALPSTTYLRNATCSPTFATMEPASLQVHTLPVAALRSRATVSETESRDLITCFDD